MSNERKYFVKMNDRFNLDSMYTHVWCCIYEIDDGLYDTVELMGETMDANRLEEFRDECGDLLAKATTGKVTSKEYGRIRAISAERDMIRYCRCLANGMSEDDASYAFMQD